ncbi:Crp/Fnr family transcriptional regulator [Carboxylicivirga sp. N1Y90]|uniref:Crp/Fnr family transcriptional regulator n=1 Tax=Carboxylicivirga fragile TaxID=3417571 RepID=UPI003D333C71|nr:Crp/Fnr family transcriptional regulator [Marinilabiliaceae bacterium N1Y90]
MEEIRQFIASITPMNDDDWQLFSSKLEMVNVKKKIVLLKAGEIENYLSFITKGAARVHIPLEENDVTFGFLFENEFVSAYDSFLTRQPSEYQTETITDTTLWRISYQDLQDVYQNTDSGNAIGRRMNENMYLLKSKRELSLLSKSAEERYLDLFTERPELIKQIPLKHIASYIGVTPQALSRIRRRIY